MHTHSWQPLHVVVSRLQKFATRVRAKSESPKPAQSSDGGAGFQRSRPARPFPPASQGARGLGGGIWIDGMAISYGDGGGQSPSPRSYGKGG